MSDELEKLKSDLEKLYAAHGVLLDMNCENIALGVKSIYNVVEKQISEQNDPWASVKNTLNYWIRDTSSYGTFERKVAEYVRHLEHQISELSEDNKSALNTKIKVLEENLKYETKLKELYREDVHKNGEYYCLKNDKGEIYKHLFNTVAIFASLEEAEFAAKHIAHPGFKATIYTANN